MKKTIRFVLVVLCSRYRSLDEWIEQIVCDIDDSEDDILSMAENVLLSKGYNIENFDLDVLE